MQLLKTVLLALLLLTVQVSLSEHEEHAAPELSDDEDGEAVLTDEVPFEIPTEEERDLTQLEQPDLFSESGTQEEEVPHPTEDTEITQDSVERETTEIPEQVSEYEAGITAEEAGGTQEDYEVSVEAHEDHLDVVLSEEQGTSDEQTTTESAGESEKYFKNSQEEQEEAEIARVMALGKEYQEQPSSTEDLDNSQAELSPITTDDEPPSHKEVHLHIIKGSISSNETGSLPEGISNFLAMMTDIMEQVHRQHIAVLVNRLSAGLKSTSNDSGFLGDSTTSDEEGEEITCDPTLGDEAACTLKKLSKEEMGGGDREFVIVVSLFMLGLFIALAIFWSCAPQSSSKIHKKPKKRTGIEPTPKYSNESPQDPRIPHYTHYGNNNYEHLKKRSLSLPRTTNDDATYQ
ncbi:hypothetical protein FGO68_gene3448 [Halteria grandinella]|uniref:Uncharacterized protein n=1 Tax=Halteria grandinella TaxID=5974 RepID=A0A8J8NVR1_HALGN|nr:hypothetical protein FGO68_gene3448 [Halteria grandinella]